LLQHIVVPPSVAEPLSAAEPLSPLELPLEPLLEPLLDPPLELPPESLSGDPLSCGSLFDELLLEQPAETPATIARHEIPIIAVFMFFPSKRAECAQRFASLVGAGGD
jgi:hypothetical protein